MAQPKKHFADFFMGQSSRRSEFTLQRVGFGGGTLKREL
jgi:hypothetical protein